MSVWAMATPPEFTRRGYGSALLAHVLQAGAADGATLGWLGATPAGLPMYEATGWRTVEEWRVFTNSSSVQFSH
jgi:GNAT superfamily N-acetyltransferase